MGNKRYITITLKDVALYLILPLHREDVFKKKGYMDIDMMFPPNKQYEMLFGHNNEAIFTGSQSTNLFRIKFFLKWPIDPFYPMVAQIMNFIDLQFGLWLAWWLKEKSIFQLLCFKISWLIQNLQIYLLYMAILL